VTTAPPPAETIELGRDPGPAVRTFTLEVVEGAPPAATRSPPARAPSARTRATAWWSTTPRCRASTASWSPTPRACGSATSAAATARSSTASGSTTPSPRTAASCAWAARWSAIGLTSESLPIKLSARRQFGGLVGESPTLRATFALLERAAATTATVLLDGETGTGKGAMAEAIHVESARKDKPFVVVDCGRCRRRSSTASCSATSAARSPAPIAPGPAPSRRPTAARCSSTRSASCRSSSSPSSCACSRTARSAGSGRTPAAHRRPADRRHQPRPARRGQRRAVPRRSLLPPGGREDHRAAAARRAPTICRPWCARC
jgi:hypothetical protein